MTALGNVCNQTLDLIFYTYHNSATRSFILILALVDMRHLSAHFSASPWLHPCVEKRIANLEQNHFPTSICSFQKVEKQIFLQILSRTFPTIYVCAPCKKSGKQSWKLLTEFIPAIYLFLAVLPPEILIPGETMKWRKKTFKGSYSYKIRWSSEIA